MQRSVGWRLAGCHSAAGPGPGLSSAGAVGPGSSLFSLPAHLRSETLVSGKVSDIRQIHYRRE